MQCYSCTLMPICKIFQSINDAKAIADISLSNCKLYQNNGEQPQPIVEASKQQPQLRAQRSPETLNKIAGKIREKQKEMNKNVEEPIEKDGEEPEKVVISLTKKPCETCGNQISSTLICHNCGVSICGSCAVESITDGKMYCEKCWDQQ